LKPGYSDRLLGSSFAIFLAALAAYDILGRKPADPTQ
jgi:hypothetical protein